MKLKSISLLFVCVLVAAFALIAPGVSFGASALVSDADALAADDESSLIRTIEGGIKVECLGAQEYSDGGWFKMVYRVSVPEDLVTVSIGDDLDVFDAMGRRFIANLSRSDIIEFSDIATRSHMMIKSVPMLVTVWYETAGDYELTETYPRVAFEINDEKLVFRNVPIYHE